MNDRKWNLILAAGLLSAALAAAGIELMTMPRRDQTVYQISAETGQSAETTVLSAAPERPLPPKGTDLQQTEPVRTDEAPEPEPVNRNLNTATAEDLMRVSGIGKVLAERIITLRDEKGGFRRRDELLEAEGIGENLMNAVMAEFEIPDELPPEPEPLPDAAPDPPPQTEPAPPEQTPVSEPDAPSGPYEMNQVTREELLGIPDMTETLADEYLEMRERLHGYQNFNELVLLKHMDPHYAWDVLREWLYLEGASEP